MAKIGFVIGCYNKVEELFCHLDILKFYPDPATIIVAYSGEAPLPPVPHEVIRTLGGHGVAGSIGVMVAFAAGLKRAHELGLDVICYRNADDWLFDHGWPQTNFRRLLTDCKAAGYNWFTAGGFDDLTLNELYVTVPLYGPHVDEWWWRFHHGACETRIAQFIRTYLADPAEFYRIPLREHPGGVGRVARNDVDANNNRWFNLTWQLIASHDDHERWCYYRQIRSRIPYHEALEAEPYFGNWVKRHRQAGRGCET